MSEGQFPVKHVPFAGLPTPLVVPSHHGGGKTTLLRDPTASLCVDTNRTTVDYWEVGSK
jgi:hypothetical protein